MPPTVLKDGEVADPFGNHKSGKDQSRAGAAAEDSTKRRKRIEPAPAQPVTRLGSIGDIQAP